MTQLKAVTGLILMGALLTPSIQVMADPAPAANPGNPTGSNFSKKHPRRAEVNKRVKNQRKRINQGVKNGTLTTQQAQQLKANDKAIKQQEHADVKANGGYITKDQQKQLNQEENANSQMIKDEKHPAQ